MQWQHWAGVGMARPQNTQVAFLPDTPLSLLGVALLLVGLVAISSASIEYAHLNYSSTTFHTVRHLIYLAVAIAGAVVIYRVPLAFWQETGWVWLFIALALLILVLIPGIGREVNGSMRWMSLGFMNVQPSEFAKITTVLYMASSLQNCIAAWRYVMTSPW